MVEVVVNPTMTAVQKRGLCSSTSCKIQEYWASTSSKGSMVGSGSYHKDKYYILYIVPKSFTDHLTLTRMHKQFSHKLSSLTIYPCYYPCSKVHNVTKYTPCSLHVINSVIPINKSMHFFFFFCLFQHCAMHCRDRLCLLCEQKG